MKEDFLAIAKEMSGSETIHYMHFMNWVNQLPGTFIGDYDSSNIKGLVQSSLLAWDMSDMLSTSSLWRDKKYFNTLLNPTQTVLCTGYKASFLKYLFGDLNHEFSMDMNRIFY